MKHSVTLPVYYGLWARNTCNDIAKEAILWLCKLMIIVFRYYCYYCHYYYYHDYYCCYSYSYY
jgi:hypothetical protein